MEVCNGNCSDPTVIPNLAAGNYTVKVQLFGQAGAYCYTEQVVTVTGSGGGNGGNGVDCSAVTYTGGQGQILVSNLSGNSQIIQIIGAGTNYQNLEICNGNCSDPTVIPNLPTGSYTVKVQLFGQPGYCYTQQDVNVVNGFTPSLDVRNVLPDVNINLYPNPATNRINVSLKDQIGQTANIVIRNAMGVIIEQRSFEVISDQPIMFNTEDYATGIYMMTVHFDNIGRARETKTFVISHL